MSRTQFGGRGGLGSLEDLSHDMERAFDSLLGRTVGAMLRSGNENKFVPTMDVSESAEAFEVEVDLPGIKPEDVKVEMHEGQLIVSGERRSTVDEKSKTYHRIERNAGSFYRAIALPSDVNMEGVDAKYEHGILHVTLPKVAKQQPKKIQIRTSGS
jgi:HSP20 family protein